MRRAFVEDVVTKHVPEHVYAEQWDVAGLKEELKRVLDIELPVDEWAKEEGIADEELLSRIEQRVDEHMAAKVAQWGPDVMRYVEKTILLQTLDHLWREHLSMLDHLRQVIGLRGYGQRDPLQEYKSEAFSLFEAMIAHLREAVTAQLMRVEIVPPEEQPPLPQMEAHKFDPNTGEDELAFASASLVPTATADREAAVERIGRDDRRRAGDETVFGSGRGCSGSVGGRRFQWRAGRGLFGFGRGCRRRRRGFGHGGFHPRRLAALGLDGFRLGRSR